MSQKNISRGMIEGYETHFLRFLPKNKEIRILDIGCGFGQLLYMMKQRGYMNVEGVDLGFEQIETTNKLGIKAERISDLEDYLAKQDETWDLITMSGVIEHFERNKILSYLAAIRKALKNNGRIVITTENMAAASAAFMRYIDFTHSIGFTERSLEQALRVAGFSEINIHGERFLFRPRLKYLIWSLLRKLWFRILSFIYLLENGVDRPKIISTYLIAVAKK